MLFNLVSAVEIQEERISEIVVPELNVPAIYDLEINDVKPGEYNLYTLTDVEIEPSEEFTITESDNVVRIKIYPRESLTLDGYYIFTYYLNNASNLNHEQKMRVNILPLEEVLEVSSDAISLESEKMKFYIKNTKNSDLGTINATFSSIFFNVQKEFELGPNERKEFTVDIDTERLRRTKAGVYVLESEIQTTGGTKIIAGNLYIGEKKGITTQEDSAGLLINTKTITKINAGNVQEQVEIKVRKDAFSRLFTSFNDAPDSVERNGFYVEYAWTESLGPAEVYAVKVKTNYILPFLVIVVAILAILGFRRFMESKLDVTKSVSHVKTKDGKFALKVKLSVKARKPVENVSLIDKIPPVLKVYEKFGTTKPDKIDAKNRRLRWDIGNLEPGEERVFSYIVYSKIGIVGKFSLPEALGVFEQNNEVHEVESNKVYFLSEQSKGD